MAKKKSKKSEKGPEKSVDLAAKITEKLRVTPGFGLASFDASSTPGFKGDKAEAAEVLADSDAEIDDLQERLYANGKDGDGPSVLLVVQGMDTSGKGGIMRHVVGSVDPQGVSLRSFKSPTAEEKKHPFLWRIRKGLPEPGMIAVFDRSHYEDVLIVRVHGWADAAEIERRYGAINDFEQRLVDDGVRVVKCMLHISPEEQKERLLARLDDPEKYYKYNPGDLDERALWSDYQEAYETALARCGEAAPWYVVPSDRKWYRNLAVGALLLDALRDLDPQWPPADFDVDAERARLVDEPPLR